MKIIFIPDSKILIQNKVGVIAMPYITTPYIAF